MQGCSNYIIPIINGLVLAILSPLFWGLLNKFRARIEGRIGPPILQSYYDVYKLFQKDNLVPQNLIFFNIFPAVNFTVGFLLCSLSPGFFLQAAVAAHSDLLILFLILASASFFAILAAAELLSPFTLLGSIREAFMFFLIEPLALAILLYFAFEFKTSNLNEIIQGDTDFIFYLEHPSILFMTLVFGIFILAEMKRFPIDNADTHLELTMLHETLLLEYSGLNLALVELGQMFKLTALLSLFSSIFISSQPNLSLDTDHLLYSFLMYFVKIVLLLAFIAIFEKSTAKHRIFRVPELLSFALVLSFISIFAHYFMGVFHDSFN